ncbi:hypothetical protein OZX74_05935 [Bifidobacterium sp. ESL0798]|uniref:hypothetical protein n=1 Tax=Bifidobacterium sp. ESL0798 TaxID=2983235 RepID=UPI0023F9AB08|nr:hypothetical protein [Bifidobacterium sp. ESL0798]WEV73476.1 hypothetical protein OZX74_05935 [Bifidobacterium sp. ESL0798]
MQLATNYATEVPGATANMAIVSAVCFVGLTALSVVFGSLRSYADQALEDKLNCNLKMALVDKSSRLALQQYEDANTHDIMQRADKQPASRIISTFTTALSIIQSIGESIGVLSILLKWNWIVALLILVSPVPSVVATFILSKNYYRIDFQRATKMREASYFQYLLSSDKTVKEIKAFSLSGYFAKKMQLCSKSSLNKICTILG